jgi:hypothetical protein
VGGLPQSAPLAKGVETRWGEGVADLATDSDYNQLMDRVNANPSFVVAVTSLSNRSFSESPDFVIEK